jgi:DNA-binding Lrp family transcriptional regulator
MTLTKTDRHIISALSRDLPESVAPFEQIATEIGISEEELLVTVREFRRSGVVRRLGATVNQRKIGLAANAMVVWRVPEERVEEAARTIVASPLVSHCYEREMQPTWPYNLYAMLHARTIQQVEDVVADLTQAIGGEKCRLLFSTREFKKVSPEYFVRRSWGASGE